MMVKSAQQGRGIALYRLGFYPKAIKTFAQILQRSDLTAQEQAINWLYQGVSFCQTNQRTRAKQAFTQALKLTTDKQAKEIAQAGCGIR